jgi:pyruvate-formate lyase-activating enzyme
MYNLLFADQDGQFYDYDLHAVGRAGDRFVEIIAEDVIPLPEGAGLVLVPGGHPIGMTADGQFKLLREDPYQAGAAFAVGATLPQGYTRTLLPAYQRQANQPLPLLGYAAVVAKGDELYVAAIKTDELTKWDPEYYNTPDLAELIKKRQAVHPENRLLKHLAHCSLTYQCFTAQNIFYSRWEGGLPTSPTCNAACLGCISKQPAECCPSPQGRIDFKPTVEELVQVAAYHLEHAQEAIISFGQGCEGEPSLAADIIAPGIKAVREQTGKGTININSNAGYTEGLKKIIDAGLDSIRVSTISANEAIYNAYYQPKNYSLADVKATIKYAKQKDVFVSLNLLTLPGLTDRESETEKLIEFIKETGVDMVQIRNLNIDPDYLMHKLPNTTEDFLGLPAFIEMLKAELPSVKVGNYSKPIKKQL